MKPIFTIDRDYTLSKEEFDDISLYKKSHNQMILNRIISKKLKLCLSIAKKSNIYIRNMKADSQLFDILTQYLAIGISKALEKYNFTSPFNAYLSISIKDSIRDFITTELNEIHIPRDAMKVLGAIKCYVSLHPSASKDEVRQNIQCSDSMFEDLWYNDLTISSLDIIIDDENGATASDFVASSYSNVLDQMVEDEDIKKLNDYLHSKLTDKQYEVFCRRKGLFGYPLESNDLIAARFGVAHSYTSKLYSKALTILSLNKKNRE